MEMAILLPSSFFLILIFYRVKANSTFDITYYFNENGKISKTDNLEYIRKKQVLRFMIDLKYITLVNEFVLTSEQLFFNFG